MDYCSVSNSSSFVMPLFIGLNKKITFILIDWIFEGITNLGIGSFGPIHKWCLHFSPNFLTCPSPKFLLFKIELSHFLSNLLSPTPSPTLTLFMDAPFFWFLHWMDLQAANLCQQTSQKSTSTNVNFLPNGIDAPQLTATAATRILGWVLH